ncbi:MAG: glycoside hydrolase family 125 protein [Fusobacteria bacterium]|nr:glycoside hydrolase family 125 protein [Fusobacteriota bacterium]
MTPISRVIQVLTSDNPAEIALCLEQIKKCHAESNFMHEGVHNDDAKEYARIWFAWANTLF